VILAPARAVCKSPRVLSRNSAAKCLGVSGGGRDVVRSGESNSLDPSFTSADTVFIVWVQDI
jgi:hypothetical protein